MSPQPTKLFKRDLDALLNQAKADHKSSMSVSVAGQPRATGADMPKGASAPPCRRVAVLVLVLLLLCPAAAAGAQARLSEPILNGVPPSAGSVPTVGWLFTPRNVCSAVLVGCRTLLTAAHCVCRSGATGGTCDPAAGRVLLPSAGVFDITSRVHPDFVFGEGGDIAVLRTGRSVEGVAPLPLDDGPRVPDGTAGRIAGFGRRDGGGGGLLRLGGVVTGSCAGAEAAAETHLCWDFTEPLAPPGEESTNCFGDSGGPLLVAGPEGEVVAGILSGTESDDCHAPTVGSATDVVVHRDWIEAAAGEPLGGRCSPLQVGDPEVAQVAVEEPVAAGGTRRHSLRLPEIYETLRVGFNATGRMDFEVVGCSRIDRLGGVCELAGAGPGELAVELRNRESVDVGSQLTVTAFGGGHAPAVGSSCVSDAETLCLQDGRFRLRVHWRSQQGAEGAGQVVPVESDDSGIFTFFSPDNWELMVKVLDACIPSLGDRFWVFYAATTNQGFTLTVEDTAVDAVNTYTNPLGRVSQTRLDTDAFATCP